MNRQIIAALFLALLPALFLGSCATSSETAGADTLTANVGLYPPPPSGLVPVRLGIPNFKDETGASGTAVDMGSLAADQLTTLAVNSQRFDVIERAQMQQLLKEQGLEGVVDPSELAQPGKIRGVEYLLLGKVTNFRIKAEKSSSGFGLGHITGALFNVGGFDYQDSSSRIHVDCGVDIRLVNPTSGQVLAAQFSEYKRSDSLRSFGVAILGANAEAEADLKVDEDNQGKILRLALDDAMRKMLPKVDSALKRIQSAAAPK